MSGIDDIRESVRKARLVPLAPGAGRNGSGDLDLPLARLARNDIGNAERFRQRVGEDFRFLQEGDWMNWDGKRWDREFGPVEVRKAAQSVVVAIREEANALDNAGPEFEQAERGHDETAKAYSSRIEKAHEERVTALRRHANSSGNAGKVSGMLTEAAPHLTVARKAMDTGIWRLNLLDGTLDLTPPSAGKLDDGVLPWTLRDPERGDLITKLAAARYPEAIFGDHFDFAEALRRIEATAPKWTKFLMRVQPDEEMRAYLRRLSGYLLTGDTGEQELFLNLGRGANGKGTFYEMIAYVLGDYAAALPIDTIRHNENRNGSQARPEIARLPGRRFVRISEADENERLSEGVVKKITGQDTIEVRDLFKGMFEFFPQFKLVIYVNDKPAIRGTDDGIWRRIRLIPWQVQIPKTQRNRGLAAELQQEADAILAWALLGYAEWRETGLAPPKSVEEASEAYRIERDPLVRFIERCLVPAPPDHEESPADLYEVYEMWCKCEGLDPLSVTGFGRRLPDRTVENGNGDQAVITKTKHGTIRYRNVQLVPMIRAQLVSELETRRRARTGGGRDDGDPGPGAESDYGANR